MFTKYLIGVALSLALVAGFLGWRWNSASEENARLVALNTGLTEAVHLERKFRVAEEVIAVQHIRKGVLLKQQLQESNEALAKALAEDTAWAAQRVPSGVSNALRVW